MIVKTASIKNNGYQPLYYYQSAREAFAEILEYYNNKFDSTLLLPGYIGFSPREGSGIYDPVCETKIAHEFYPMNDKLNVDLQKFRELLDSTDGHIIVLLVHYFGYPDKSIEEMVEICRNKGAVIIEDAAHALYTDYIDHSCGQYGDYVLYSLHKMLPFEDGGMLRINSCTEELEPRNCITLDISPFSYNFSEIARKRKRNAFLWYEILNNHDEQVEVLRPFSNDVTPQTFPIVIKNYDRNDLYFKLNEEGFGAVSLYHTMIEPVQKPEYEKAVWLSQHIINMPVHQDVDESDIRSMADRLLSILG